MTKRVQAGDTSDFAVAFALLPDPEEQTAPRDARGSWGRFELWVQGRNLTEHRDRSDGLHEAVTWYVRPLVSWIAGLRFSIHDLWAPAARRVDRGVEYVSFGPTPEWIASELAERRDTRLWSWRERHALSSARLGGIVPEVVFRRVGDEVEITWESSCSPSLSKTRFLESSGGALVSLESFERSLGELESVITGFGWAPRTSLECAGLAPFHDALDRLDGRTDWVMDGHRRLGPIGLVAQRLDPDLDARAAAELVRVAPAANVHRLPEATGTGHTSAWQQGYETALSLRRDLGLNGQPLPDERELLARLGIATNEIRLPDRSVRSVAMAAVDLGCGPVVATNSECAFNEFEVGRRASVLQGLGHLLLDRTAAGRTGFPHGSDWSPRAHSARANAFAAMLLAPPSALAGLVPTRESMAEHSKTLGASKELLAKHAANLGLLPSSFAEGLDELD